MAAPEHFMPKISLRRLIGFVTACAISMGVFQQALTRGQIWAVLLAIAISSILLPALFYIGTFSLASLFSTVGAVADAAEEPEKLYTPTLKMPDSIDKTAGETANPDVVSEINPIVDVANDTESRP